MANPSDFVPAEPDFPIDVVITWVDGEDPAHKEKLNRHLVQLGYKPRSAGATRFRSVGEIDYCIRSLLKFAPFLRYIHVVTDAQTPPIFGRLHELPEADRAKLKLVDHKDIFPPEADCLPTFNNRAIESVLYRVPGLAEHFVYLNDDFFLINPVRREDWFQNGKPVIRGFWSTPPDRTLLSRLRNFFRKKSALAPTQIRAGFREGQVLSARLAGFDDRYFAAHHTPTALRRSTFENFFREHPELLQRNIQFRLRDPSQYSPQFLANHIEIRANTAVLKRNYQLLYMKPQSKSLRGIIFRLKFAEKFRKNLLFACIQNLDNAAADVQACVLQWLTGKTR